jgi:Tfp pilus assembly protein PilN
MRQLSMGKNSANRARGIAGVRYLVWFLVLVLVILHQDNWNWDNDRLIAGFLPVSLAYHVCISLAAGFVWYLATVFAWPVDDQRDSSAND